MRILQLGKYYPPDIGGIESLVMHLTEELNRRGIRSDVLCARKKIGSVTERSRGYQIWRTSSLGTFFSTAISPAMILRLKKVSTHYNVIHIHHPDPMANLALFLVKPKCHLVVHWHSDIVRQKRSLKLYAPLLQWMLRRADVIIVSSEAYMRGSAYLQMFRSKVKVIPYGINADAAHNVSKQDIHNLKKKFDDRKIFLSLGRLVYYKGLSYLVQATTHLTADHVIIIAGDGPQRSKLENLASELGVQNTVFFAGKLSDTERWAFLHSCEALVLPSVERSEAFGIVQVEAMACGKPVISTDIKHSGVGWVNKNNVTGLVVPPKDPKSLAKAIQTVTQDKKRYNQMCHNSLLRYQSTFHVDAFIDKVIDTYVDVLADD
ncbi:glycosyltransferase [Desulfurispira natronophila]|uniref:Rhamnosyl/mannosyltransferase n=1 Tax=Desulfurispira natronophila TaxID=682562 RepID=A0A7W7Y620_9BACT|nr:glycosyltransferase [Desulfurispira natronophila]MBB5022584.1 rhamnosyl/mannosyltransferase [Desulfurispira natronophila]